jgi:predicted component of type VI protein secretion system
MNFGRDPDDWFEGTEPEERPAPGRGRDQGTQEDWLQDAGAPPRSWLETIDRRVLALAAVGVALLIAVLAAAGVFSSNSPTSVTTVTSTPASTTPTTQPTTTPPAQALPAPTSELKPGDSGAQVAVLQRALASLGFSTGKIDGQYGPSTEAAVERFQRSAQLTPDGIVGPATLTALATALRGA